MASITASGTIQKGNRQGQIIYEWWSSIPFVWKAGIGVVLAILVKRVLNQDPLANGYIPASKVLCNFDVSDVHPPSDSWFGKETRLSSRNRTRRNEAKLLMGLVDFGGPNGHQAEKGNWGNVETERGTRCSTTQSAVTAYFCGAEVAENQDLSLGTKRKSWFSGVEPSSEFITCRYNEGVQAKTYQRSVYLLLNACEAHLAQYSHSFSIVAQPDGTFLWLQSYIQEYSLHTWMDKKDMDGTPHDHLTFDALLSKLKQVDRLMKKGSWSEQAMSDHNVDKGLQTAYRWKPEHRLSMIYWDEACEYPLPPGDDVDVQNGTKVSGNQYIQIFVRRFIIIINDQTG